MLQTNYVGQQIRTFESTDSTNVRAMEWAESGGPSGAVVVADSQTAGRGRLGRRWEGGEGESLLFSVIVRPDVPDASMGLLPLASGLAVVDAVTPLVRHELALKWPNDVLLAGMKCAGVLVEGVRSADSRWAVVGIGINVNQEVMPRALEQTAISLRQSAAAVIPRPVLLASLLEALESRLHQLEHDRVTLLDDYRAALSGFGRTISLRLADGKTVRGRLAGVLGSGALEMEVGGTLRQFSAGDVSLGSERWVAS
ncbi:MAG: biotin--[acetyl-CoA-carboxylase] ligase [Rhodothermales bacterium]|nr:biotin--[acetyl-CoA-carboxylase] ligase [Rhodothermales bacterium]